MVWHSASANESQGIELIEKEAKNSSDRAVGILVGSLLESRLTGIIAENVDGGEKLWKDLTRPSGPLGAFATKIHLAHMIRLVSKEGHAELIRIKDIRNRFAHRWDGIETFQSDEIRTLSMKLSIAENRLGPEGTNMVLITSDHGTVGIGGDKLKVELANPRDRFIWSAKVFMMAFGLKKSAGPYI